MLLVDDISDLQIQIKEWSGSDSRAKRYLLSRLGAAGCVPLELLIFTLSPLSLLASVGGNILKGGVKLIRLAAPKSEKLKKFDDFLPGPIDFWNTVKKTAFVAAGFFTSLFVGIFHPMTNYMIHSKLGLVVEEPKKNEEEKKKDEAPPEPVKDEAPPEPVKDEVPPEPVKDEVPPEPLKDEHLEPPKDEAPEPPKDAAPEPPKDKGKVKRKKAKKKKNNSHKPDSNRKANDDSPITDNGTGVFPKKHHRRRRSLDVSARGEEPQVGDIVVATHPLEETLVTHHPVEQEPVVEATRPQKSQAHRTKRLSRTFSKKFSSLFRGFGADETEDKEEVKEPKAVRFTEV